MKTSRARWVWNMVIGISMLGFCQVAWTEEQTTGPSAPQESTTGSSGESKTGAASATAPQESSADPESAAAPQEPTAVPAASADASTTAAPSEASSAGAATGASAAGMVSVDFKDADIRQVLRIIALKSGVDIVAGVDVEGLVTIKLTNVPWEQALNIILRTYGFTYAREGNIVRVMTLKALEEEALSTRVFPLDYAKAKEVPDVIKEMLSDRGRVKFDERTNAVIVTDIPASLFQIQEVVERLDQRTPQVLIETKIVETKLSKEENLGIDWSDSLSLAQTASAFPSSFPFVADKSLGSFGDYFIGTPVPKVNGPTGVMTTTSLGSVGIGTLTGPAFSWTLNALHKRTNTNIISNPSLAVLNNQQAKIHIGEEFPVPTYTIDPTTGRTSISGYTPKLTGTVLTVTPHVNPSEEIVVDLEPQIITVGDDKSYSLGTTSGSVTFPRFTTQMAKTTVRIRNGNTIAIGGLVKKSNTVIVSKVPILGDIPIVGLLFRNTSENISGGDPLRQDVLIFLTVSLSREDDSPAQKVAAAPGSAAP